MFQIEYINTKASAPSLCGTALLAASTHSFEIVQYCKVHPCASGATSLTRHRLTRQSHFRGLIFPLQQETVSNLLTAGLTNK